MPTYQYLCQNCEHEFDELQMITEPPLVQCPNCNKDSLVRVLGAGGGLIFKGSGFYLTDYKGGSTKGGATEPKPPKAADAGKPAPGGPSAPASGTGAPE